MEEDMLMSCLSLSMCADGYCMDMHTTYGVYTHTQCHLPWHSKQVFLSPKFATHIHETKRHCVEVTQPKAFLHYQTNAHTLTCLQVMFFTWEKTEGLGDGLFPQVTQTVDSGVTFNLSHSCLPFSPQNYECLLRK